MEVPRVISGRRPPPQPAESGRPAAQRRWQATGPQVAGLDQPDRALGLACVEAYNDWMVDEWCAGDGYGRLLPMTLIPLWDPDLAAAEVRRCAAKGAFAVAFSENPTRLRLPSIHSGHWDPLFAACEEADTVVNLHIGSSSTFPLTSLDAPRAASLALTYQGAAHAPTDWLTSGVLERFGRLKMALSEGQVGCMPFILERLGSVWEDRRIYGNLERLARPPRTYLSERVCGGVFDDVIGVRLRNEIGPRRIMFEVDYPRATRPGRTPGRCPRRSSMVPGSTPPRPTTGPRKAIECYGLGRAGTTS